MIIKQQDPFYEPTMNQSGFMLKKLDPFSKKFLLHLKQNHTNTMGMEIGAAYGVVSLEAYKQNTPVLVNDLSDDHLLIFKERADDLGIKNVMCRAGDFFKLNIPDESLYAIYISRVLHFFEGEKIINALNLFHRWLIKGGRVYLINETPYFGTVKNFIPKYEKKKKKGDLWPGLMGDHSDFDPNRRDFVNQTIHLIDEDTLKYCVSKTPFNILEMDYYNRKGYFPEDALCSGKESLGAILCK